MQEAPYPLLLSEAGGLSEPPAVKAIPVSR